MGKILILLFLLIILVWLFLKHPYQKKEIKNNYTYFLNKISKEKAEQEQKKDH